MQLGSGTASCERHHSHQQAAQGRIACFHGRNAAFDGMATGLGVGFGVFECNRLLRLGEQTAQAYANACLRQLSGLPTLSLITFRSTLLPEICLERVRAARTIQT
jgi:hypothetical protein